VAGRRVRVAAFPTLRTGAPGDHQKRQHRVSGELLRSASFIRLAIAAIHGASMRSGVLVHPVFLFVGHAVATGNLALGGAHPCAGNTAIRTEGGSFLIQVKFSQAKFSQEPEVLAKQNTLVPRANREEVLWGEPPPRPTRIGVEPDFDEESQPLIHFARCGNSF
jgi:hypothetical protein